MQPHLEAIHKGFKREQNSDVGSRVACRAQVLKALRGEDVQPRVLGVCIKALGWLMPGIRVAKGQEVGCTYQVLARIARVSGLSGYAV